MNDETRLLRLADRIVKEMDIEIAGLPRPAVYWCRGIHEIRNLRQHYEGCIEDYTKRLPGSKNGGREYLMGLIECAERELGEVNYVLETLGEAMNLRAN